MEQSNPLINFDELLAPISTEHPTGINIREDDSASSAYYKLKDARTAARADERNQAGKPANQRETSKHWATILDVAPQVLMEQTKDLEVAAWYVEALVRKHGLAGLRDGFKLLNGLIRQYWNNLYPAEDENGVETKIAPISGLFGLAAAGTLPQPISCLAITDPNQKPYYEAWQYQQAFSLLRAPDAKTRNKRIKSGIPTLENLETAAKKTSIDFYQRLKADLEATIENFNELVEQVETCSGEAAPNSSFVRNALNNIHTAIRAIAKHAFTVPSTTETSTTENFVMAEADFMNASTLSADTLKQRAEALATIQTIAEFFRKTEPHSPISYALERVVKWADLPLPELLKELVIDPTAYKTYCSLTGIELPKPPVQTAAGTMPGAQPWYNDPMNNQPALQNPMQGGYPSAPGFGNPPPMGGDPMFNNTF